MSNPLDVLIPPQPKPDGPNLRWATVVATHPLQVRLDGEDAALAAQPDTLVEVDIGARVLIALDRRRIIVLGRATAAAGDGANLMPDSSVESSAAIPSDADYTTMPSDRWRQDLSSGLTAGTIVRSTDEAFTGVQSLFLSTPAGGQVIAYSPNAAVVSGETYLVRFRAKQVGSGVAALSLRVAGGSDDSLSEYPGDLSTTAIEPDSAPVSGAAVGSSWQTFSAVVTIPSGVSRISARVMNYNPPDATDLYLDEFEVYPLTGPDAWWGDTGWIEPVFLNGWVNYGGSYGTAKFRRIGTVVHTQGLVKNGTAGYVFDYPPGFRAGVTKIYPAISNSAFARINNLSTGTLQAVNYNNSWVSIEIPPFPVST